MNFMKASLDFLIAEKKINTLSSFLSETEKALIFQRAEELMQQTFIFDKPWDMERCLTPYRLAPLDWNAQRNDDEEWCFMLNRMDYLDYLILASLLSHEIKYAEQAKHYILDWIAAHSQIKPEPSTRTLDTGIRVMNWFEALPYLEFLGCLSDCEREKIGHSMQTQLAYLKDSYLPKYKTSNWGSIQTCAMVSVLPFLLEDYQKDPLYLWAKDEMELQFSIQVYPDGMHWEQSTMYHIEVLNYGMKALYYMGLRKESSSIQEPVYRLAKSLLYQLTPSGGIETFGDSDRVCARDVFTRAAVLFSDCQFRFAGTESCDLESAYVLGGSGAAHYNAMSAEQPTQLCYDGTDSGMYVIRSSWSPDASFTMFTNGSLGSGHGHSDNLHISLTHKGQEILIDSGRYTYREDDALRTQLKGMQAHNGIILDEHEYCLPSDSWGYADFGLPLKNYVRHAGSIHYLEGYLVGHDPLQIWMRKVIFMAPSIWLIVDEVKADGVHKAHTRFHFDPSLTLKVQGTQLSIEGTSLLMTPPHCEMLLTKEACSLRYNEQLPHTVLHCKQSFTNHLTQISAFYDRSIQMEAVPVYQNLTEVMSPEIAQARKFILSEQESYTVAICSQEIYKGKKVLSCEGMPYHAKCVVIHQVGDEKQLIVLKA